MSKIELRKVYKSHRFRRLTAKQFYLLVFSCIVFTIIFLIILFFIGKFIIFVIWSTLFLESSDSKTNRFTSTNSNRPWIPSDISIYDKKIRYNDFDYLNPNTLTYERRTYSNNIEILYRMPNKINTSSLLLIFHGCGRTSSEWFSSIERQRIIGAAIDFGFTCIVFQATDKISRCWATEIDIYENKDVQMVYQGLTSFFQEFPHLKSLPCFTFGASSGGMFSSIFAINQRYKIQGQIIFISILLPEILQVFVKKDQYPPTVWIHMLADVEFASQARINSSMQIFKQENIPHINFPIQPIRLKPSTFHDRIPTVTKETSAYIYYRLQQNKWLDSDNYLLYNPRRKTSWKTFLFSPTNQSHQTTTILRNLYKNQEILSEFFNTIYGEHEISYERSYEAFKWLKQISTKSNQI